MRSILYLWGFSLKNRFRELLRKPAMMILYVILAAILVWMFVLSRKTYSVMPQSSPLVLKVLFFALVTAFAIFGVYRGLSNGGSFFDMCDVNILFVSPVNPRVILIHGIASQIKTAFLASFFILFQAQSLKMNFGIEFGGTCILLLGFMVLAVLSEIAAMFIYSFTNGNAKRQAAVRIVAALMFAPALIYFFSAFIETRDARSALIELADSIFLDAIPIVGWITQGSMELIAGNTAAGLLLFGLSILLGIALILLLAFRHIDYYEDVLCATETGSEKKRARMEGNLTAAALSGNRKIRVKGTGISGFGASVFLGKHFREAFRENRFKLLSFRFIIMFAAAAAFTALMREMASVIFVMGILIWMQIFLIGTERGMKELLSHYIYLMPIAPVKKLIYSNGECFVKTLAEAVILFSFIGYLCDDKIAVTVCCIFAYTVFTMMLVGVNYLSLRIFKETINQGVLLVIYMLGVCLIMTPGIIAGFIIGISAGPAWGILALTVWEAAAAMACFYLSKEVLHRCDMMTGIKKA